MPAIVKKRRHGRMTLVALARRKVQQFGPYKSLALLFVPLLIVEPLKIAGVAPGSMALPPKWRPPGIRRFGRRSYRGLQW
jgi:hypothetical protein